jgi:hypothetical protein
MTLSLASPIAHGQNFFVSTQFTSTVGEYTTSGAAVNSTLVTGLTDLEGIAVAGSDLFTAYDQTTIGEYTTSGATVNASLITGLNGAGVIAITGSDLFVTNYSGNSIGEYTTSGATVNASLVTGLDGPTVLSFLAPIYSS